MTSVAVAGLGQPYRPKRFNLLDWFVTFRAQPIGRGRERKIALLLWSNVEVVIVVVKILYGAEDAPAARRAGRLQFVTDLAVVGIRERVG